MTLVIAGQAVNRTMRKNRQRLLESEEHIDSTNEEGQFIFHQFNISISLLAAVSLGRTFKERNLRKEIQGREFEEFRKFQLQKTTLFAAYIFFV